MRPMIGASGRNRTGTPGYGRQILSLMCLPISPPRLRPLLTERISITDAKATIAPTAQARSTYHVKKGSLSFLLNLEREIGFEPTTYTLARYRSTN